jgi:hypothetical protein
MPVSLTCVPIPTVRYWRARITLEDDSVALLSMGLVLTFPGDREGERGRQGDI